MNKGYIYKLARLVVADHYAIKIRKVNKDSFFIHEFDGDAQDREDIRTELEDAFRIEISDKNFDQVDLVCELVDFLDKIINRA